MPDTTDPTETYLPMLLAGDLAGLTASFAGEPLVEDPLSGHVAGALDFQRFAAEKRAWLDERAARLEPLRTTRNEQRTVVENLLHLTLPGGPASQPAAAMRQPMAVSLPVAVVGVHGDGGWLTAI